MIPSTVRIAPPATSLPRPGGLLHGGTAAARSLVGTPRTSAVEQRDTRRHRAKVAEDALVGARADGDDQERQATAGIATGTSAARRPGSAGSG